MCFFLLNINTSEKRGWEGSKRERANKYRIFTISIERRLKKDYRSFEIEKQKKKPIQTNFQIDFYSFLFPSLSNYKVGTFKSPGLFFCVCLLLPVPFHTAPIRSRYRHMCVSFFFFIIRASLLNNKCFCYLIAKRKLQNVGKYLEKPPSYVQNTLRNLGKNTGKNDANTCWLRLRLP